MGDFNIDYKIRSNAKWLNLIQLFDLTQIVKDPTRITETSSTIIDHVYTTNVENIKECFVRTYAVSDHFSVCFTRKINSKIPKNELITTFYRCFKTFDETSFLADINSFETSGLTVDDDFLALQSIIVKHLDKHAPVKVRRVKTKRLTDWYTPEIGQARIIRDSYKRLKEWTEYNCYRNKTRNLICSAKRKHFINSIENAKDTRTFGNI